MDVGTKEGVKWIQGPERELGGSRDQREVRNHQFSLCVVLSSVEKKGWVQYALFCPLCEKESSEKSQICVVLLSEEKNSCWKSALFCPLYEKKNSVQSVLFCPLCEKESWV